MWICSNCGYKNNNSNKRCHGHNCKAESQFESKKQTKVVLDECPKCLKETIFVFDRKKMVEIESLSIDGESRRMKTIVQKRYKCIECGSLCFQTGKSKPVPDEILEKYQEMLPQ